MQRAFWQKNRKKQNTESKLQIDKNKCVNCKTGKNSENEKEIEEDFATLSAALMMLQMDYLGGHGSRGYGRVAFSNFSVRYAGLNKNLEEYAGRLKTALEGSCLK